MVVEERHPVFETGIAPALADRLVEPVVAGRRAEGRHIGLPEALDALGGELNLAHGHEIEGAQGADRALGLRIEGADRFERVAEEVEADRIGQACGKEIDDAAAHRVFARVPHGAGAQEAVGLQPADQLGRIDHVAGRGRKGFRRDAGLRRHPLNEGVHRGREDARLVLGGLGAGEPGQGRHALRRDRGVGRHAVVGLAIPGREGQDLDLGRDEGEAAGEVLLPLPVARHVHQNGRALHLSGEAAREIGDGKRVEAVGHARTASGFGPS